MDFCIQVLRAAFFRLHVPKPLNIIDNFNLHRQLKTNGNSVNKYVVYKEKYVKNSSM